MEKEPCLPPIAPDRALGHTAEIGDLLKGVSAKKVEVDQLGERRVHCSELVECIGQSRKLGDVAVAIGGDVRVQCDVESAAAAF